MEKTAEPEGQPVHVNGGANKSERGVQFAKMFIGVLARDKASNKDAFFCGLAILLRCRDIVLKREDPGSRAHWNATIEEAAKELLV